MRPRAEVPFPVPLGVHRHERPPPEAGAGDQVGYEPVEPAVGDDGAGVDRERHRLFGPQAAGVTGPAERPAQVAAEQPEHRDGAAAVASVLDDRAELGVGGDDDAVVGHGGRRPPRLSLAYRHQRAVSVLSPPGPADPPADSTTSTSPSDTTDEAATTPRNRRTAPRRAA